MTDICLAKIDSNSAAIVGPAAAEFFQGIGRGEVVIVQAKRFANDKFYRKVMATIREAFDNQDEFDDFERFLDRIKLHAGHTSAGYIEHDGEVFEVQRPDSVSIYGCTAERFQRFAQAVPAALDAVLPEPQYEGIRQYAESNILGGV